MNFNENLLRGHILGDDFKPAERPPIGLRPRYLVNPIDDPTARVVEILEAIGRYEAAGYAVPQDWRIELAVLHRAGFV